MLVIKGLARKFAILNIHQDKEFHPCFPTNKNVAASQPFVDLSTKGFKLIRAVLPLWNHTVCTIYSND